MSLNQITSPQSNYPIYAASVNVPQTTLPADAPVISIFRPAATNVTITTKAYKLGDLYTFICRAQFTAGATVTPIEFKVNLPGFMFTNGVGESAPVIKLSALPNIAADPTYNGIVVTGFNDPAGELLKLQYTRYEAGIATVNSVAGGVYDLTFTMNALVEPVPV